MKKLIFFIFALVFTISIVGCKKQDDDTMPLRSSAIGRWELLKIETTVGSAAPVTVNYTSSDYFDFKAGDEDILERKLGTIVQSGNYVFLIGNDFNITIDGKTYNCIANTISAAQFDFTAKEGSTTLKVYLKR